MASIASDYQNGVAAKQQYNSHYGTNASNVVSGAIALATYTQSIASGSSEVGNIEFSSGVTDVQIHADSQTAVKSLPSYCAAVTYSSTPRESQNDNQNQNQNLHATPNTDISYRDRGVTLV